MSEISNETKYFAVVAKVVDDFNVVINRGSKDGVKVNSRYLIYGVGAEVNDPETGETLGQLEIVRGTGVVTHVQERMATITSNNYEKPVKRIRKIHRTDPFAAFSGRQNETIEEEDENQGHIPYAFPQRNDRVRPL